MSRILNTVTTQFVLEAEGLSIPPGSSPETTKALVNDWIIAHDGPLPIRQVSYVSTYVNADILVSGTIAQSVNMKEAQE